MSKALKILAAIAGGVAIIASGGALFGPALGLSEAAIGTLSTISTIASVPGDSRKIGSIPLKPTGPPPAVEGAPP